MTPDFESGNSGFESLRPSQEANMEHGIKVITTFWESSTVRGMAVVAYSESAWATAPEWLAARGYHLTFFTDIAAASKFVSPKGDNSLVLWECMARDIILPLPPLLDPGSLGYGKMADPTPYALNFKWAWPDRTMMAKEIKLIKRVSPPVA